ncbi:MAG: hypothetical protein MK135_13105, partial [Polyangiaceae bacterium]|nr:hypothetical protein [Polyangiaceae bacterium]
MQFFFSVVFATLCASLAAIACASGARPAGESVVLQSETAGQTGVLPTSNEVGALETQHAHSSGMLKDAAKQTTALTEVASVAREPGVAQEGRGSGNELTRSSLSSLQVAEEKPDPLPHLRSFYRKLNDLGAGNRSEPVKIMWMGDSHTAADFMTDPIRLHLQQRYGNAGPGYIR